MSVNPEIDQLLNLVNREVIKIQESVARVNQGDFPNEFQATQTSLNHLDGLLSQIKIQADQAVVAATTGSDMTEMPKVAERNFTSPTYAEKALTPSAPAGALTGAKAAAMAGLKAGAATSASKGMVKIAKAYIGPNMPKLLQGPGGEALLSLLLPLGVSLVCQQYGDHIPHAKQLADVANLAIQGTSQEAAEMAFSKAIPMFAEMAALGAGMHKGQIEAPPVEEGPVYEAVDTTDLDD